MTGKKVTIVNPESYESAAMGFQLKEGYYSGKVGTVAKDFVVLQTVIQTSKKEGGSVPVKQFIPLERIKRLEALGQRLMAMQSAALSAAGVAHRIDWPGNINATRHS